MFGVVEEVAVNTMVEGVDFPSLFLFPDFSRLTFDLRVGGDEDAADEEVGMLRAASGGEEDVVMPAIEGSSFRFFETRVGVAIGAVCSPFVGSCSDDIPICAKTCLPWPKN